MSLTVAVVAVGLLVPAGAEGGPLDAVEDAAGSLLESPAPTYPDLVPDVTDVIVYRPVLGFDGSGGVVYGPAELAFDTWSQNLGTVALDLVSDEPTNVENPTVSQCVAWTADVCRERRQVGGFELHPEHNHFHFNEFARYELRKVRRNGRVNYSDSGLLALSDKVSFCLLDSTQVRDDARPVPTYLGCTVTREGISAGWADIYGWDLAGQQMKPPGGVQDGRYALVISLDYAGRLWESDDGNNVVEVIVEISNGATQAAIVERRQP